MLGTVALALTLNPSPSGLPCTHKLEPESFQPPKSPNSDAAGELFRNIARTAEGPLNPPTLILLANYFVTLCERLKAP